ncbi:universal stress protein [Polaromonas sp.]|uniref:universal stress protein n=1 Tax=Polaromonas sp. TaxID=1869339 RepID=UPI003BAD09C4
MNLQSILAVTDFSASGHHALERAAMLAAQQRALLKLVYADMDGSPARADAQERLAHLARQLAQQFGIDVRMVGRAENTLHEVAEEARGTDLLVLAHEHRRSLASILRGHPAMQLMRLASCPILVTKLAPGARYARILVAVNFRPESKTLVRLACLLDSDAEVGLFHALSTRDEAKLRSAEVSVDVLKAYRQECMLYAQDRILSLTDSFDARRNRVQSTIERGDPARQAVIQQQYAGADLLVVGNRRRTWGMDFLAGSVAQRVLSWARSDVLLVPHDFQLPTRAAARQRVSAGCGNGQGALLAAGRSLP